MVQRIEFLLYIERTLKVCWSQFLIHPGTGQVLDSSSKPMALAGDDRGIVHVGSTLILPKISRIILIH